MEGAASQIGRKPVTKLQHVPGCANVNRVFTLPRITTKQARQDIKSEHAGQYPSTGRKVDATANQGKQLGHWLVCWLKTKKAA
jgi:hypothetical protein